jgi:membrane-associated phospholipid phosphatase
VSDAGARLDRLTLGYAALASLATLLRGRGDDVPWLLAEHALVAGLTLVAPRLRRGRAWSAFFASFYPLLMVFGTYTAIGLLNRSAGVCHDLAVQRWEQALFGGQPSREWIRAYPWPLLSWPLHLAYLSYYLVLVGAPLGILLSRPHEQAVETTLAMMKSFYACYAVFLFFPVAGPRYLFPMAQNAASAVAPAVFAHRVLERGSAWGTAFPSSHVAVALVAAGEAWRRVRPLGLALIPVAVLLTIGTVYCQFHYALDALAGALVAAAVLAWPRRGKMRAA